MRYIARYVPEEVADTCGVDAGDIRAAARLYARNRPSLALHGLGVTEHTQGTDGVMCLANLALLTGNVGKPRHRREPVARPEQRAGVGAHGL